MIRTGILSTSAFFLIFGALYYYFLNVILRSNETDWNVDWQYVMPSMSVKVFAYSRPNYLDRLLSSLKNSSYPSSFTNIPLDIFVDGLPRISDSVLLKNHLEVCRIAKAFIWPYGPKRVKIYKKNIGILGQYLNAWKRSAQGKEMSLFLEDDVILSQFYFQYLYTTFKTYAKTDLFRHFYGISLQQPKTLLLKDENGVYKRIHRLPLDPRPYLTHPAPSRDTTEFCTLYSFPRVGTWGQIFFRDAWLDFLSWYNAIDPTRITFRPDFIFADWAIGRKRRVWTPYFMHWVTVTGAKNLYFLFSELDDDIDNDNLEPEDFIQFSSSPLVGALAISTQEKGNNFKQTLGPDTFLVDEPFEFVVPADLMDIPSFDFCLRRAPSQPSDWFDQPACHP